MVGQRNQAKSETDHGRFLLRDEAPTEYCERDISLAQEAHIDGFALNIANDVGGVSPALQLAFYVASRTSFKLFFSFDYAGNGA
ncbi:hypothetical protein VTI74DRAFT_9917 [Chaetomium olivicolor]